MKKMRNRFKTQKPTLIQRWNKQIKFYHNKTSKHFYLGTYIRGDYVAGHDMTTHPELKKNGKPKNKYLQLKKNPNPSDTKRKSYIDKHLRKNNRIHFADSNRKRLTKKRNWKISKSDKKVINKVDKNQI